MARHGLLRGSRRKPTFRVGCQLVFRGITDQPFALGCERDVRRRDAVTLIIGDDLHASVFEDANARVRRAEIDTDHSANIYSTEGDEEDPFRRRRVRFYLSCLPRRRRKT